MLWQKAVRGVISAFERQKIGNVWQIFSNYRNLKAGAVKVRRENGSVIQVVRPCPIADTLQ
ncbi:MAG: hypothetical protein B6D61_07885 [Bacteroidetes bacterium 4484_249]|nr:MAG: hypothetical protein B6D61_07885 [Bacteroidetes bacterium 4484_249]